MWDHGLPGDAARRVAAVHGEAGTTWLRELPEHVAALMREWSLVAVGEPFAGARAGLVAPARRGDGAELVLKILPAREWAIQEATALAHWAGRGAARLVAADRERGALLVERVVPGTALTALCAVDDRAATAAAATVLTRLRSVAGATAVSLPDIASWTAALRPAAEHGPAGLVLAASRAAARADELTAGAPRVVLHGDLQHYNVLEAGAGSWLAIDPKGLLGPAEAEPAALLRNPRRFILSHPEPTRLLADRVAVLAEHLGDEPRLLAAWAYVLAVVAAAWAFEDHEGGSEVDRWLAIADLVRPLVDGAGAA